MKKGGYIRSASNLGVTGLMKKALVELKSVDLSDYTEDRFFVTARGEDWLLANQQKLNLRLPVTSTQITDDDIPF
jgi:hypothetical protein